MPVNNPFALTAGIQYVDGTASTATSFTGTVAMSFNANNQIVGQRADQSNNLLIFPGVQVETGAVWSSGTGANTLQFPTGTTTIGAPLGGEAILIQLDQTTTITGGAVTIQGTYDGINWVTIPTAQVLNPNTFAQLTNPYTFVASTNQPFLVVLQGYQNIRLNLTSVITGTGTVTPFWTVLSTASLPSNTTVTGTVTVVGTLTNNNAAPVANNVGVLPAQATTAAPAYTNNNQVLLNTTTAGGLRTDHSSLAGTALGAPSNYGTSPGAVSVQGVNAFITNTVPVTLTSTTITGTVAVTQSTSPWVVGGGLTNNNAAPAATNLGVLPAIAETAYATVTYTTGDQVLPVTDLHGALNQDLQAYAGTQLTGTVTAYGTAPTGNVFGVNAFITNTVPVTLTSTTITGTVAVTQSTSPWVIAGNKTNNNAAPGATNEGVLPAVANAATQTWTEGNLVLESVDLSGRQRVRGTLTHNNAAPAADQLSVIPALANAATPTFTEGDQVLLSTDLSGNIRAIEKKDTGRTYLTWFIDAVAGVTTEALVSLQVNKGGTLQTAGTTYTVTAGKTLRLQSISCSVQETNGTVQWLKVRVRAGAAVTVTSPVIAGLLVATDAGNTNNAGYGDQSFPDGFEIAAGQQVGISQVTGSTSTNVTVTLVGYEY